jgi:hypothetical protein
MDSTDENTATAIKKVNDSMGSSLVSDEHPYIKYSSTTPDDENGGYNTEVGFEHFVGGVGVKVPVDELLMDVEGQYALFEDSINNSLESLNWRWKDLRKESLEKIIDIISETGIYEKFATYFPENPPAERKEKDQASTNRFPTKGR